MYLASQSLRRLISQILSYPNSSDQEEAVEGHIRAEQINNVKHYLTWICSLTSAMHWCSLQRSGPRLFVD